MAVFKLNDRVFYVGAIHNERRLFDQLIPLPDGTTYNAYIIRGNDKTALIDTVDPEKREDLFKNLEELGVDKIDFVIANHAEQDHSGSIPFVLERYPMAKVVTNEKCKNFLKDLLHLKENDFITISDGEELSLGDRTLKFVFTPWVHWPETMVTFLEEDGILFSCDFFGSHLAKTIPFIEEDPRVIEDAKRYYAEIMMPFRPTVRRNVDKVKALNPRIIAPSHGPVYMKPEIIINAYLDWTSENVKNQVVLPYVSMHGSTKVMVDYLIERLTENGIEVFPFDLSVTDIGKLAMTLVDSATLILATPQFLGGAHPLAVYAAFLVNVLRPKLKFIGLVGSFGWGGMMVEQIKGLVGNLKAELIEPVLIKGLPDAESIRSLDSLIENVVKKHGEAGLL